MSDFCLVHVTKISYRGRPAGSPMKCLSAYTGRGCRCANCVAAVGESTRCYREANHEKLVGRERRWRKANPEKKAEQKRRRRARQFGAALVDHITFGQYAARLEWFGHKCAYCAAPLDDLTEWHWDHVIPLSRYGSHHITNLAPACAWCNLRKSVRLPWEWSGNKTGFAAKPSLRLLEIRAERDAIREEIAA